MEKEQTPNHWFGEDDESDAGSESAEEESKARTQKRRPARGKITGDWLVRAKGDDESEESSSDEEQDVVENSKAGQTRNDRAQGYKKATKAEYNDDQEGSDEQQPSELREESRSRTRPKHHGVPDQAEQQDGVESSHSHVGSSKSTKTPKSKNRVKVIQDPSNPLASTGLSQSKIPKGDLSKTGVVYISRIPPFMKPATLARYLQPFARHGAIGRVFLTPENKTAYGQRVRQGGNKKRSFVDGWVEFHAKKDAKICAETLNARIVGGKKGGYYHDDVWNMKYLRGFKWNHLTEQIRNEEAERAGRMRAEIRRAKKEDKMFVEAVEKSKVLKGIEQSRKRKRGEHTADDDMDRDDSSFVRPAPARGNRYSQHFTQNKVVRPKSKVADDGQEHPVEVQRVLSKIL